MTPSPRPNRAYIRVVPQNKLKGHEARCILDEYVCRIMLSDLLLLSFGYVPENMGANNTEMIVWRLRQGQGICRGTAILRMVTKGKHRMPMLGRFLPMAVGSWALGGGGVALRRAWT